MTTIIPECRLASKLVLLYLQFNKDVCSLLSINKSMWDIRLDQDLWQDKLNLYIDAGIVSSLKFRNPMLSHRCIYLICCCGMKEYLHLIFAWTDSKYWSNIVNPKTTYSETLSKVYIWLIQNGYRDKADPYFDMKDMSLEAKALWPMDRLIKDCKNNPIILDKIFIHLTNEKFEMMLLQLQYSFIDKWSSIFRLQNLIHNKQKQKISIYITCINLSHIDLETLITNVYCNMVTYCSYVTDCIIELKLPINLLQILKFFGSSCYNYKNELRKLIKYSSDHWNFDSENIQNEELKFIFRHIIS